jgi:hypothetical protein
MTLVRRRRGEVGADIAGMVFPRPRWLGHGSSRKWRESKLTPVKSAHPR